MPQLTEAGKRNSAADTTKIQAIHDHAQNLGAVCDMGNTDSNATSPSLFSPAFLASDRGTPVSEARALLMKDSTDSVHGAVRSALQAAHPPSPEDQYSYSAQSHIRDMFPDQVVYDHKGKTLKRKYEVDKTGDKPKVKLGKSQQVHVAYVPMGSSNPNDPDNDGDNDTANPDVGGKESKVYLLDAADLKEREPDVDALMRQVVKVGRSRGIFMDAADLKERNIPKSERDNIDAADFAGKNKSFPIVKPEDVAAAAASIGRAGPDNYSTDELKKRIIAIAKRKGESFEAQLPKAWEKELDKSEPDEKESGKVGDANLIESDFEISEMLDRPFVTAA